MFARCRWPLVLFLAAATEDLEDPRRHYSEEEYARLAKILGRNVPEVEAQLPREEQAAAPPARGDQDDWRVTSAVRALSGFAETKLRQLLTDTFSESCRDLVTNRFVEVFSRVLREDWLPFETHAFRSECPQQRDEQSGTPLDPDDLRLCYVILAHEEPEQVKRLVSALTEADRPHSFVVHVDAKSSETYDNLKRWSLAQERVFVMDTGRTNVSWGGFGVVRGTLNALDAALSNFEFDWIVTASGYTYPLASNRKIRETLAAFPRESQFMEIRPQPNDPSPRAWHQYVECDNKLRRIYRMAPPVGAKMYMGSQWMMITRAFAQYVVGNADRVYRRKLSAASHTGGLDPGTPSDQVQRHATSFAEAYEVYGAYTMVADENYFVTVLKNSPFCHNHVNDNFLHVQFDKWENEKPKAAEQKCLQPNPRHCGRSPTTLTMDYLPVLELGGALFARKFDSRKDSDILDALDEMRLRQLDPSYAAPHKPHFADVRIVWRPNHHRDAPRTELCVSVAEDSFDVRLAPCDPTASSQRFHVGPCSTDGNITLRDHGPAVVRPGLYAPAPFCPISSTSIKRGQRRLCLDLEREKIDPGTNIIAYPCSGRWNQLFGFGAPDQPHHKPSTGHVFISVPYAFHVPKELCLEALHPGLKVQACHQGKLEQLFHVERVASRISSEL